VKFLSHNLNNSDRWQTYKQLELISDRVSKPQANQPRFLFGLDLAWHTILSLLIAELIEEQQVEYLERCWRLDEVEQNQENNSHFWQRLWTLMN
jgi:hypothetical protein